MQLSDRFAASEDVVARQMEGETVLLDLNSGLYFGLDPVGGRIWELLAGQPHTLGDIADRIEDEFDAPRDRIANDLIALAKELRERELIVPHGA
ncbi:MAG: PqqD family protein [Erythrobacter sp.]|uniref:PqqD family protein n=1 Tax=Erythrobacter sp. TaxID=1042 RepID=UPI003C73CF9E